MGAGETQRLSDSPPDAPDTPPFLWLSADLGTAQPASLARLPPDAVGHVLGGRFELRARLGEGGMGVVYRAHDRTLGRDVALKVLPPDAHHRMRDRLVREGELTAALKHSGIVGIHAGGDEAGVTYLAYELVEGGQTLEDLFASTDRERLVRLVLLVARAVGHAHQHGIVHRDLKPGNILIDPDGDPRVADFGLAWSSGVERLTQTGNMVGTPLYMAPELMTGAASGHEPTADVWSLGAILYRALTGQLPFNADTLPQLAAVVAIGHVVAPRRHDKTISPQVEAVCLKALRRDPDQRLPDANAFAAALEEALGAAVGERKTLLTLGLAAGGSLLVAAVAIAGVLSIDAPADPRASATPAPSATPSTPAGAVRAHLRAGRLAEARAGLASLKSPTRPARVALEAELALVAGHPLAAREQLEALSELPPEAAPLLPLLRGLPKVTADAPVGWRDGVARWSLRRGLRGVDWLAWCRDPRRLGPEPEAIERIELRARRRLHRVLALTEQPDLRSRAEAGLGALARGAERTARSERALKLDPRSDRALELAIRVALADERPQPALDLLKRVDQPRAVRWALLRARALVALGRHQQALPDLEQAAGPLQDEPRALALLLQVRERIGPRATVRHLRQRLRLLRGARREEAFDQLNHLRRSRAVGDALLEGCRKVLELDPLSAGGHYYVGRAIFLRDQVEGVIGCATALLRDPRLLDDFFRVSISALTSDNPVLVKPKPPSQMLQAVRLDRSLSERLGSALLHALAVELEAGQRKVPAAGEALCDRILAEDPLWIALVLRGLFRLRQRKLLQARQDLDEAELLFPRRGVTTFYRALLEAAERAPTHRVKVMIEEAQRRGWETSKEPGWRPGLYPELQRYLADPGFKVSRVLGPSIPDSFRDEERKRKRK